MFSKILLCVLLLTCIYTYMLKSIKDNNDLNFQKLPDNFKFESNEIQTIKPNLKFLKMHVLEDFIYYIFGWRFAHRIRKCKTNAKLIFNTEIQEKIKEQKNLEDQKNFFSNELSEELKKTFNEEEQEEMKKEFQNYVDKQDVHKNDIQSYMEKFIKYIYDREVKPKSY